KNRASLDLFVELLESGVGNRGANQTAYPETEKHSAECRRKDHREFGIQISGRGKQHQDASNQSQCSADGRADFAAMNQIALVPESGLTQLLQIGTAAR